MNRARCSFIAHQNLDLCNPIGDKTPACITELMAMSSSDSVYPARRPA